MHGYAQYATIRLTINNSETLHLALTNLHLDEHLLVHEGTQCHRGGVADGAGLAGEAAAGAGRLQVYLPQHPGKLQRVQDLERNRRLGLQADSNVDYCVHSTPR